METSVILTTSTLTTAVPTRWGRELMETEDSVAIARGRCTAVITLSSLPIIYGCRTANWPSPMSCDRPYP